VTVSAAVETEAAFDIRILVHNSIEFQGSHSRGMCIVQKRSSLLLSFILVFGGWEAWAHHSLAAEFDLSTFVKVTGVIKRVEWQNPHVWFFVEVTESDSEVTTWGFETWPPGLLMRRGVTKDALSIGTVVNVEGARARDGSNNSSTRRLTFADGTPVLEPREEYLGGP